MRAIGLSCILACLFFLAPSYSSLAAAPCELHKFTEIDLVPIPNGLSLAPVVVNGTQKYLMVDLCASSSGLLKSVVMELRLPTKPLPRGIVPHYYGATIEQLAIVPTLQIGNVSGKDITLYVVNDPPGVDPRMAGVLGVAVLEKMDVELDLKNNKLRLFSPHRCSGNVVYWSRSFASLPLEVAKLGNYSFAMDLDGKPVRVSFSMNYGVSMLSFDDANRIFGLTENSPGVEPVPGHTNRYRYPFKTFATAGFVVKDPDIILTWKVNPSARCDSRWRERKGSLKIERCFGNEVNILLGTHILHQLRVYLAFEEKKLYLSATN